MGELFALVVTMSSIIPVANTNDVSVKTYSAVSFYRNQSDCNLAIRQFSELELSQGQEKVLNPNGDLMTQTAKRQMSYTCLRGPIVTK